MDRDGYIHFFKDELFEFFIKEGEFVSFVGNGNDSLLNMVINKNNKKLFYSIDDMEVNRMSDFSFRKNLSYILNRDIPIFVSETVEDEIAFGLEGLHKPKTEIAELINTYARNFKLTELLKRSPYSLGSSDKAKLRIVSSIIYEPKILVLDNILSELDNNDLICVVKLLNEYVSKGNIVLNFTENNEELLFGERIVITDNEKVIADGKTSIILKEEKLFKKLGIGLPFMIEFNRYLKDYGIIKKDYMNLSSLVGAIWK